MESLVKIHPGMQVCIENKHTNTQYILRIWLTNIYIFIFILQTTGPWLSLINFCIVLSTCISLGGMFDSKSYAVWLEPLRLIFLVVTSHFYSLLSSHFTTTLVSGFCLGSLFFWPLLRRHFDTLHFYTTSAPYAAKGQKTK